MFLVAFKKPKAGIALIKVKSLKKRVIKGKTGSPLVKRQLNPAFSTWIITVKDNYIAKNNNINNSNNNSINSYILNNSNNNLKFTLAAIIFKDKDDRLVLY